MLLTSTRAILDRRAQEIIDLFAEPLAVRLGRSAAEIRTQGLWAGDFKTNESIEVAHADGSTMSFRYAFAVFDPQQELVGVFTEHCGYFCLRMPNLKLDELREGSLVQRYAW